MKDLELLCFNIIAQVGEAKSCYLQSLKFTKKGKMQEAQELMKQGDAAFLEGHKQHVNLIQQEACGKPVGVTLLLLHAEDQMMATETIKILVDEFKEVYQKIGG